MVREVVTVLEQPGRTRHLVDLMRKSLAVHRAGGLDPAGLAYDVESLVRSLDEVADEDWVAALRAVSLDLDGLNASRLDEDLSPSQEELVAVGRLVESIERLPRHEP